MVKYTILTYWINKNQHHFLTEIRYWLSVPPKPDLPPWWSSWTSPGSYSGAVMVTACQSLWKNRGVYYVSRGFWVQAVKRRTCSSLIELEFGPWHTIASCWGASICCLVTIMRWRMMKGSTFLSPLTRKSKMVSLRQPTSLLKESVRSAPCRMCSVLWSTLRKIDVWLLGILIALNLHLDCSCWLMWIVLHLQVLSSWMLSQIHFHLKNLRRDPFASLRCLRGDTEDGTELFRSWPMLSNWNVAPLLWNCPWMLPWHTPLLLTFLWFQCMAHCPLCFMIVSSISCCMLTCVHWIGLNLQLIFKLRFCVSQLHVNPGALQVMNKDCSPKTARSFLMHSLRRNFFVLGSCCWNKCLPLQRIQTKARSWHFSGGLVSN